MKDKTVEYVRVLTEIYAISLSEDLECEGLDGECDPTLKQIYVSSHLSEAEMKITVLHELLHAFFHEVGASQIVESETEEVLVTLLTSFFNSTFCWTIRKTSPDDTGRFKQ